MLGSTHSWKKTLFWPFTEFSSGNISLMTNFFFFYQKEGAETTVVNKTSLTGWTLDV